MEYIAGPALTSSLFLAISSTVGDLSHCFRLKKQKLDPLPPPPPPPPAPAVPSRPRSHFPGPEQNSHQPHYGLGKGWSRHRSRAEVILSIPPRCAGARERLIAAYDYSCGDAGDWDGSSAVSGVASRAASFGNLRVGKSSDGNAGARSCWVRRVSAMEL